MGQAGAGDHMRKALIDFAEWHGESAEDAEWAVETYLREVGTRPNMPREAS